MLHGTLRLMLPLLALVAAARPALGEDEDERAARQHNRRGAALVTRGEFASALGEFEMAERLHHSPDHVLNIAITLGNLGREEEAVSQAGRFLAECDDPALAERVRGFVARLEVALARTHGRIEVSTEPPDAHVRIGGVEGEAAPGPVRRWLRAGTYPVEATDEGHAPASATLVVRAGETASAVLRLARLRRPAALSVEASVPGARVLIDGRFLGVAPLHDVARPAGAAALRVEAPGHLPFERTLALAEGSTERVFATLAAVPATAPEAPPAPTAAHDLRVWGWVGVGAGAALLATAVGLHVGAAFRAEDAGAIPSGQPQLAIDRAHAAIRDDVEGLQTGAWVLYGVGGAAAIAGVVLLAVEPAPARGAVALTALPVPGGLGAAAVGHF